MNQPECIKIDDVEYVRKDSLPPVRTFSTDDSPYAGLVGRGVFIRTVTNYFTGKLTDANKDVLAITDVAQVFYTGRLTQFLADGTASNFECEVWPDGQTVFVAVGGVIDVSPWDHALFRKQV